MSSLSSITWADVASVHIAIFAPIGFHLTDSRDDPDTKFFKDYTNSHNVLGYIPFVGTMIGIQRIMKFFPPLFDSDQSSSTKITCVVEVLRAGVEITSCGAALLVLDIPVFLVRLIWSKYSEDIINLFQPGSFDRGRRVGGDAGCFG